MFLITPIATEKTTALQALKQYVFYAPKNVTKVQVKQMMSQLYGVQVTQVRILRTVEKMRGGSVRRPGVKRPERKKVIVTIKGDKLLDLTKLKK